MMLLNKIISSRQTDILHGLLLPLDRHILPVCCTIQGIIEELTILYMSQGIQEWTKSDWRKTALNKSEVIKAFFHKFYLVHS